MIRDGGQPVANVSGASIRETAMRGAGFALAMALSVMAVGLCLVITPLYLPTLPLLLWKPFFWLGGFLMISGGLMADVALIFFIARRLRARIQASLFRQTGATLAQRRWYWHPGTKS
jgi:hypothetical protein